MRNYTFIISSKYFVVVDEKHWSFLIFIFSKYVAIFSAFLLGLGDSSFNTQVSTIPAFHSHKVFDSIFSTKTLLPSLLVF